MWWEKFRNWVAGRDDMYYALIGCEMGMLLIHGRVVDILRTQNTKYSYTHCSIVYQMLDTFIFGLAKQFDDVHVLSMFMFTL